MTQELVSIPFHGSSITATSDQRVALKPVCEAMGLDYSAQYRRLERTSWAVVAMTATTGADGKTYEMVTIDRRTFTMWLATIETSRLKNDLTRHMVELYQAEAADALDAYFHEGGAVNARATVEQLEALDADVVMALALKQADQRMKALEAKVARDAPKLAAYDDFLNGSGVYQIGTAANLLGIKNRTFWKWLHESKLLIPKGTRRNQPYSNPKTRGWFEVKTYPMDRTNGHASCTTYITAYGLDQIRQRLIADGLIESQLFALPSPRNAA